MSALNHYRIYDQPIACDRPLNFAPIPSSEREDHTGIWTIEERDRPSIEGDRIHDLEDHPGGDRLEVFQSAAGQGEITYADWHFAFDLPSHQIAYEPPENSAWALDTLLERIVLPIALLTTDRPLVALHGSALRLPDGDTIAIIGDSGAGKSTTALGLVRRGATLLADDLVLVDVERRLLLAGAPSLRLALPQDAIPEASISLPTPSPDPKRIFVLPDAPASGRALPLTHLFSLGGEPHSDRDFELTQPRGGHAAALLLDQCFAFSQADPAADEARFRRAMRLLRTSPLTRVEFRRGANTLTQLDAIAHALGTNAEAH
ncbi:hypothetical protein FRC98_16525 [Lujinxingia vulgaris]|uniref:HPr kinase/phosphorylase C-terminal domain-containing protein n=1 Tax=Lujinxingia vulgaris TaxID=2600176 RepID=A0A5C6X6V1_9DELT|nr:hypothetical protein [Lujinxingia vulgaris]TXD35419.1 hypothetical protein FRC98_16525 [Lujinxingia vulgaris]